MMSIVAVNMSCNPDRLFIIDVTVCCWLGCRGYFEDHRSRHRNASPTSYRVGVQSCQCSASPVDSDRLLSSSAVMAIAAASLADIYEPHERGAKMGIYYAAPLLGTSLGPFLGGGFAQAFGWRAVFWFAVISGAVVLVSLFVFFKDSFRKERSLTYQNVVRRRLKESQLCTVITDSVESSSDKSQAMPSEKAIQGLEAGTNTISPSHTVDDVTLSFKDVNPFPPMILVLKRPNNNAVLLASGWFITEHSCSKGKLILCQV